MVGAYFAVLLKISYFNRRHGCQGDWFSNVGEGLHVEELAGLFHQTPED